MNESSWIQGLLWQSLSCGLLGWGLIVTRRWRLRLLGARASYALWLSVPAAVLVSLLPAWGVAAPDVVLRLKAAGQTPWGSAVSGLSAALPWLAPQPLVSDLATRVAQGLLVLWLAGVLACVLMQVQVCRRVALPLSAQGRVPLVRTAAGSSPALLGCLRPQLCLPQDFEQRFTATEQRLIVDHELAHWQRRDPWANSLGWLLCSVHWFNPLMWWALRHMRADQELAVDARVLQIHGSQAKAAYAMALLKAQELRAIFDRSPLLACSWQAQHPLMERIHMLKHHELPTWRRRVALTVSLGLTLLGAGTVHALRESAAPPAVQSGYHLIQIDADVMIDGVQRRAVRITQNRGSWSWVPVRVPSADSSGEWMVKVESQAQDGDKFRLAVVVFRGDSTVAPSFESDGFKGPARVMARPVLLVEQGQAGRVEIGEEGKPGLFAISLTPRWVQADSLTVLSPVQDR